MKLILFKMMLFSMLVIRPAFSQEVGKNAPPFVATTLEGEKIDLNDYKGKPVILDFWASWCAPCLKEMPFLMELQEKYDKTKLSIIAVNLDNDKKNAHKFLAKLNKPVPFPVVFDDDKTLAKLYQPAAMPTTVFIDAEGKVQYRHKGFKESDKPEFIAEVEKILNTK